MTLRNRERWEGRYPEGMSSPDAIPARLLDAAENRAREGLRVLEDHARFVLDDARLTAELKGMRHALAAALSVFPRPDRTAARDTLGDVGVDPPVDTATPRRGAADVLAANAARVQEALRSLEEWAKPGHPAAAAACESLRYRGYTVEKRLLAATGRPSLDGRDLYLLLTRAACRLDPERVVREAAAGGVGVVQVREKAQPAGPDRCADGALLDHLHRVRDWTADAGALLIVNDRPDLAALCGADGVHVGQGDLPPAAARRVAGDRRRVGLSTHSPGQIAAAPDSGADHLGVGPVFTSGTKAFDRLAGLDLVRHAAAAATVPWFAIGGITPDNAAAVREAGAVRVAVCGAVCGAEDPRGAAERLRA